MWRRRRGREHDLERELRSHLELELEEHQEIGLPDGAARNAARRALGNVTLIQEEAREMWGWTSLERMLQDTGYAVRVLRKHWAFTVAALLTLALGIGANTAMFSVVYAVLVDPLPYPQPDRLMFLAARSTSGAAISFSYPDVLDWQRETRAFQSVAAYQAFGFTVIGSAETQRFPGRLISATFFSTLGVTPALGRDFLPQDDRPESQPAVIITDRIWRPSFNADRAIVNKNIRLNGRNFAVIGVLPPAFQLYQTAEIFAPIGLGLRPSERGERRGIYAIGRLDPHTTLQQAKAEAGTFALRLAGQYPATNGGVGAIVEPLSENFAGKTRTIVMMLFGAVTFVLLIACANVGNLLLARSASRQTEIALRIALGAGRVRLLRQMLTENLLLSVVGGALGLGLATLSLDALAALLPPDIARLRHPEVNGWVLGFTLLASVLTGILFGLIPARQAIRSANVGSVHTLRAGPRRALLHGLVAAEVALSFALLTGAGLMIRTLLSLRGVDPGFHASNVLHTQIVLPPAQYGPNRQLDFFRQAIARTRFVPGVTAASAVMCLPLSGSCWSNPVEIEGADAQARERSEVNFNAAGPDYFRTLGIPFLQGRDFEARDTQGAPRVAIVSQSFARRYLAGENAIGKRIRERSAKDQTGWATIVGVVGDVRRDSLDSPAAAEVYFPFTQSPINFMSLVARAAGNPANLASAIRSEMHALDGAVPFQTLGTMEDLQGAGLASRQLPAVLLGLFAAIALILAVLGIYGVISYSVAQRTKEIGIRMALGARRSNVLGRMLGQGMVPVWAGLVAGIVIAVALNRTLTSSLYGVSPTDPVTFSAVSLLLIMVSLVACIAPARHATRVDPLVALRHD